MTSAAIVTAEQTCNEARTTMSFHDAMILCGLLSACGFITYTAREIGNAIHDILSN